MAVQSALQTLAQTFDAVAYGLTLFCGLLTIMIERYLYQRRGYQKEARITAFFGWFYILGGSALFLSLALVRNLL